MDVDWLGVILFIFVLIPVILGMHYGMICWYILAPLTAIGIALVAKSDFGGWGVMVILIAIFVLWILLGIGTLFGAHHYYSDKTENIIRIIGVALGVIALVCIIYAFVNTEDVEAKRRAEWVAQERKSEQEKLEREEFYKANFGEETERFDSLGLVIRVFRKARTLVINDHPYNFDDIMWCDIDEEEIFTPGYSHTNITAKNRPSSVLKGMLITGLTGNVGWGLARATADVDIDGTTTVVPDSYETKYTGTIAMFDKDRADHKREYTFITYNQRLAVKLQEFIERIQHDYRFEDENDIERF